MREPNRFSLLALLCLIVAGLNACSQESASPAISADIEAFAVRYTEAWNSGDPAAVANLYAPDGALTVNGGEAAQGRDAVQDVALSFMTAFPDMQLSNDRLEAVDGRINYHWTLLGTNSGPPFTGNRVEISGFESWILADGPLVQDSLGSFDTADYDRQLFAQPAALRAMGASVFPADRSLARAEDGIALEDGSLLVTDQQYGLRKLSADGSSAPFGKMNLVGYRHSPPDMHGAANGISLEPAGTHVLVADIYGGGIYRVALKDEQTSKIYQHEYGVNSAVRDSRGNIWFTQSAHNGHDNAENGMWAAIDRPLTQGALLRIPEVDGRLGYNAELVLDGFQFANGLALDETTGYLYLAETVGGRVMRFALDPETGSLGVGEAVVENVFPDNIELDDKGRLWIASPLPNNVLIFDTATGESRWLLEDAPTRETLLGEWAGRAAAGQSRMDLLTPDAWMPMPGFITGVIFAGDRTYLSGLGNALIAVDTPAAGD